jgi:hypothetical protein
MKAASLLCLFLLSFVPGLLCGCVSSDSTSAAANPAIQKKGHWVNLPPETGSYIPRRVWVDDSGQPSGSPSGNNVQTGSASDFERIQRNSNSPRPGS